MKIYSWNVLFKNQKLDEVLAFIEELDFDVLALQEVSEELLVRLKRLPFNLASSTDTIRVNALGKTTTDSLVILSRYPIEHQEAILFPKDWYQEPTVLRARVAGKLLRWRHSYKDKSALRAEITLPEFGRVQVCCAHLAVVFATPATRQAEFDFIIQKSNKEIPTIFCGDFNILELPHITFLNWLSGGNLIDWMLWWRERQTFKGKFLEYSLQNPLDGMITHPIAFSQIDHILLSESFLVRSRSVIQSKFGSDHHPVMVEATKR